MTDNLLARFSELTDSLLILNEHDKIRLDNILFNYDPSIAPPSEAIEVLTQTMDERTLEDLQYNPNTKVGVIPVTGMLTDRYDAFLDYYIGITAYENVIEDAKSMLEAGAENIVLHIDSGGGQAYNMLTAATELRNIVDQHGAKLVSFNDGLMASAAYGLGSVAHEVYAHPDAETGSIGVVVSLTDYSQLYKDAGIKRIWVTAGENKVPFNPDGSFSQNFLDNLKTKVDALYERFTSHVASYRNTSQESVKELGANTYTTSQAVTNGLIDGSLTREEFVSYINALSQKEKQTNMKLFTSTKDTKMSKETEQVDLQAALEAAKVEFEKKMSAEMEALKASLSTEFSQKLEAKESELSEAKEKLASMEQEKADAKAAERKATLSAIVGDVQAEAKAEEFAELSDKAFASMVEMLKQAKSASEESELMTEIGDQGQPVVEEEVDVLKAAQEKLALRRKEKFNKKGAN